MSGFLKYTFADKSFVIYLVFIKQTPKVFVKTSDKVACLQTLKAFVKKIFCSGQKQWRFLLISMTFSNNVSCRFEHPA